MNLYQNDEQVVGVVVCVENVAIVDPLFLIEPFDGDFQAAVLENHIARVCPFEWDLCIVGII